MQKIHHNTEKLDQCYEAAYSRERLHKGESRISGKDQNSLASVKLESNLNFRNNKGINFSQMSLSRLCTLKF